MSGLSIGAPRLPQSAYTGVWGVPFGTSFEGNPGQNVFQFVVVPVLAACTLTGVQVDNGGTVAGNAKSSLFDITGARIGGAGASTPQSNAAANAALLVPFAAPVVIAAPAILIMGVMTDSASATFWRMNALCAQGSSSPGSFVIPTSLTPPAATARNGFPPIMALY